MAEKKTFEKALADLQEVVEQLEKGDLSLEKSLTLYEKGVKLTTFCQKELAKAKLKIEELRVVKQDD